MYEPDVGRQSGLMKGRTSCAQIGAALSLPFDHAMSVESRMMPQHTALAQGVIQQLYVVILRSFVFQKQIVGFCLLEARLNGRKVLERVGLTWVTDLLHFDFNDYWERKLVLRKVNLDRQPASVHGNHLIPR